MTFNYMGKCACGHKWPLTEAERVVVKCPNCFSIGKEEKIPVGVCKPSRGKTSRSTGSGRIASGCHHTSTFGGFQ